MIFMFGVQPGIEAVRISRKISRSDQRALAETEMGVGSAGPTIRHNPSCTTYTQCSTCVTDQRPGSIRGIDCIWKEEGKKRGCHSPKLHMLPNLGWTYDNAQCCNIANCKRQCDGDSRGGPIIKAMMEHGNRFICPRSEIGAITACLAYHKKSPGRGENASNYIDGSCSSDNQDRIEAITQFTALGPSWLTCATELDTSYYQIFGYQTVPHYGDKITDESLGFIVMKS